MVDISSILNKYRDEKNKNQRTPSAQEPVAVKSNSLEAAIASATNTEFDKENGAETISVYRQLSEIAKSIYDPSMVFKGFNANKCDAALSDAIALLQTSDSGSIRIILSDYSSAEPYLSFHAVNTCLLALILGVTYHLDNARLIDLGKGALMHDIGLLKFLDMLSKPEILSNIERKTLRNHTTAGAELVKSLDPRISPNIVLLIQQEHERIDGSGYPLGLKDSSIGDYAQIVGLCDTYEAMTHRRPYRDKFSPLEAIKLILAQKNTFSTKIAKALIQKIGIFPVGTIVRLSSREVGVVWRVNPDSPFCPVINIMFDATTREVTQPKQVDLANNKMLTIEDCIKS